jgi:hypothetical protein
VAAYGPPKWEKPLRTNDQGQITVPTPWAGRYVLEVVYVYEKNAEVDGVKFDRMRHESTLSFVHQNECSGRQVASMALEWVPWTHNT